MRRDRTNCRALGEGHPSYAISLNNLAQLYRGTGRHGEAEPLFRRAVAILRAALGTRHPDYRLVSKNHLINQQEGDLPVPDGEVLADSLEDLPAPPAEAGEGDAGSDASGA